MHTRIFSHLFSIIIKLRPNFLSRFLFLIGDVGSTGKNSTLTNSVQASIFCQPSYAYYLHDTVNLEIFVANKDANNLTKISVRY